MLHFPTRRVEVCNLKIPIDQLPAHLNGVVLVQLSDFHFNEDAFSRALLQETVGLVQQIQPDLICYTGDFINGQAEAIAPLCHALQSISGKYGSVAVLGNHDHFEPGSSTIVTQFLERSNIRVLKDEVCYPFGPELAIVGLQCLFAHHDLTTIDPDRVMATISEGVPKIVLTHGPRVTELIAQWKIDLQLSGHTHGGQFALPMIGPLLPKFWDLFNHLPHGWQHTLLTVLPRRIIHNQECRYIRGLYPQNQGYLYVNRGLGAHFPGRLFCRPEITVITLVSVPSVVQVAQAHNESTEALALSEIST